MTETDRTGAKAEAKAVELSADPEAEKKAQAENKKAAQAAVKAQDAADRASDTDDEEDVDTAALEARGKAVETKDELSATLRRNSVAKAEREQAVPAAQRYQQRVENPGTAPEFLHFGGLSKAEAEVQYYATDIGHL